MKIGTTFITIFVSGMSFASVAQPNTSSKPAPVELSADLPDSSAAVEAGMQPAPLFSGASAAGFGGAGISYGGTSAANREAVGQVSVLCFRAPDQNELAETMEDTAVLAFLLSRNLEHSFAGDAADTQDYKLGIPMLLNSGNQAVGASYIQGFGAILKMQVRFPLVSPAGDPDEAETAQTDSEWEEARRELIAKDNPGISYWPNRSVYSGSEVASQPYDAKLVETLKKRVLVLLKNASNLRHLDGNEWIIVKIVGPPSFSRATRNSRGAADGSITSERELNPQGSNNALSEPVDRANAPTSRNAARKVPSALSSNQATVMTLRVKKSAANAFASGSLSQDQFIKSAEVVAYLNPVQSGLNPVQSGGGLNAGKK
jgi:hypothetical protein